MTGERPIIARMVRIRPASAADGLSVAQIRAESWRTAYADVFPAATLAERTAPAAVAKEGEWRSAHPIDGVLIAEEPDDKPAMIGFVSFGPERGQDDEPGEPQQEPPEHGRAEIYAIYVLPDRWSTGTGRALMDAVLHLAAGRGYTDISLWVMEANDRARRFYELAGFQPTGESVVLGHLGGVTEVRYRRPVQLIPVQLNPVS
jgi:ribosomal protein S18 acetylase RimI-like enzyme